MNHDLERSKAVFNRLVNEGLKPHGKEIVQICNDGDVACVVWELTSDNHEAARALGWDGVSSVFAMPNEIRIEFAKALAKDGDVAGAKWLRASGKNRIYCMAQTGTLLLNVNPGEGFSIEPGTLDHEWMS